MAARGCSAVVLSASCTVVGKSAHTVLVLILILSVNNIPQVSTTVDGLARQHHLKIQILPSYFLVHPLKIYYYAIKAIINY